MRKSIVAVLAAALACGPATSAALAADEPVSVTVAFTDLDVADPAGADALSARIESAVDKVCERPDMRNLKGMVAWEECKSAAIAAAMEQLSLVAPYAEVRVAGRF